VQTSAAAVRTVVVFSDAMFQLGDVIDARDEEMGAWFEARIVKISPVNSRDSVETDDGQQPQSSEGVKATDITDEASPCNAGTSAKSDESADDGFLYSIVFEQLVSTLSLFANLIIYYC